MHIRTTTTVLAVAMLLLGLIAGPASADHTKGKKYLDIQLTREAAIEADDGFGIAPEGTSGSGAMYLNHGQERFCLFLDFELPADVTIVALHLHEKDPASANPQTGPVAIDASPLLVDGGTASQGCVEGDREFLRGVLSSPDEYYINAHTTDGASVIRANIGQN